MQNIIPYSTVDEALCQCILSALYCFSYHRLLYNLLQPELQTSDGCINTG